ncbi:MAG: hypothetical protein ACOX6T_05965 [Myxococcales bacterium]|jgi:hypothetical protein
MNVIPEKCHFHFIALLPEPLGVAQFLTCLKAVRAGISIEGEGWKVAAAPRKFAFGTLVDGPWSWRVVADMGELPELAWKPGFGDSRPPAHRSHAFVFLLSAPQGASGLDRVRASLDLAAAWTKAGASQVAFPSAGTILDVQELGAVEPARLEADTASNLLVSLALMGRGADGRTWVRTRGMVQFGLIDLCCALPAMPQPPAEAIDAARVLFGSVAPYLISIDRSLEPKETVRVGGRTWRVADESALAGAPPYYGILRALERV